VKDFKGEVQIKLAIRLYTYTKHERSVAKIRGQKVLLLNPEVNNRRSSNKKERKKMKKDEKTEKMYNAVDFNCCSSPEGYR